MIGRKEIIATSSYDIEFPGRIPPRPDQHSKYRGLKLLATFFTFLTVKADWEEGERIK